MVELKTSRGLLSYFLLSAITFGIYPMYFIHRVHVELNESCKEDGKTTRGFILYFLFGIITLGIYPICWWCFAETEMHSRSSIPAACIDPGECR